MKSAGKHARYFCLVFVSLLSGEERLASAESASRGAVAVVSWLADHFAKSSNHEPALIPRNSCNSLKVLENVT